MNVAGANTSTLLLVGLAVGSLAQKTYDVQKAVDGSQSSAEPKLGG